MIFKNKIHEKIFDSKTKDFSKSNRFLAAIYLLTSDNTLWKQIKNNCRDGKIEFNNVSLSEMTPEQYTLLMAAKDLYLDETHLSITDLADKAVLDSNAFALVMNAICIARYGKKNQKITEVTQ